MTKDNDPVASGPGKQSLGLGFRWGHVNINVTDLERSIAFYEKLGFELYLPDIPYLGLSRDSGPRALTVTSAIALGLERGASGRGCIMQLTGGGYPKIDLIELEFHTDADRRSAPLNNADLGLVRLCLIAPDVAMACAALTAQGVEFLSTPQHGQNEMVTMATCKDPDGTLIELLEIHRERWPTQK